MEVLIWKKVEESQKEFNDPENVPSMKIFWGEEISNELKKSLDNKELMEMIASDIKFGSIP